MSLFSLCCLRITTQLRSGAVDKMTGIFTKRIWQTCICQPNELKREIKKKTGGAKQKSGGPWPSQAAPSNRHCNDTVSKTLKTLLCSKNILRKLVGYQQPTCLCVKMEFVAGTISLSCELFSLSKARADLKPMQLYWAPRLWVPTPWWSDRLFIFAR